ncbi:MAG: DNA translocase FtsK 4TM domain-containing protein [Elusimicrobia bacterium]|nr:DNA translocase FtsK 4TM domain-containing protein [Elusimicrobiota bacterium]
MRPTSSEYYLKARARSGRGAGPKGTRHQGWGGITLFTAALLTIYVLCVPFYAGTLGRFLARLLRAAFGQGAFLVPWICAVMGWKTLRPDRAPLIRTFTLQVALLWLVCTAFALGEKLLGVSQLGGGLGHATVVGLTRLVGEWGAGLLMLVWAMAIGLVFVERSPQEVVHWMVTRFREDWQRWRRALETQRRLKKETHPRSIVPKRWKPAGPRMEIQEDTRLVSSGERLSTGGSGGGPRGWIAGASVAEPGKVEESAGVASGVERSLTGTSETARTPWSEPARRASPRDSPSCPPPHAFQRPSLELLNANVSSGNAGEQREALLANARLLEQTLADFRVDAKVVDIHPGPVITRYDLAPAPGVKVQAIAVLANDIALAMKAMSLRVLAPVPGKAAVGIEIPSPQPELVTLRDIVGSSVFQEHPSPLTIALGKTTDGTPTVADLAQMPHLLIAGSTGAGKSICIHSLIVSLMYKATPTEVKLLLIDPKRLELPLYQGIPYLFDPSQPAENVAVITDSKEAAKALTRMVRVMDQRFQLFAQASVRDIQQYNQQAIQQGKPPVYYAVVIIDELADLMAVASKEVEGAIQRLAQMARAVGIHLVLATQRPSVDVITGLIKANLPARMAFRVASQTDSRVIIDMAGAETLLGQGDMLFLPPGAPKPIRVQGAFLNPQEIQAVIEHVRRQGRPSYEDLFARKGATEADPVEEEKQEFLRQALQLVLERKRVSQDLLKAHFGSSARATDLLSLLEVQGFIAKPEGTNRWTVFFDRIEEYLKNQAPPDRQPSSPLGSPLES